MFKLSTVSLNTPVKVFEYSSFVLNFKSFSTHNNFIIEFEKQHINYLINNFEFFYLVSLLIT